MRYQISFEAQEKPSVKVDADDVEIVFAGEGGKETAIAYNFIDANNKTVAYFPFDNVWCVCPG